jgi:hypothetical protein
MQGDDPTTSELKAVQDERARGEERDARESESASEERAHRRRAEKAQYLRDKLAEAERSEREG